MTAPKVQVPRVYAAINAITAELAGSGIAKTRVNAREDYRFRGIDDVLQALAPLLARHRLCILPRVLERDLHERAGVGGTLLVSVLLKVAFDMVSVRDGSMHTIEVHGEALDGSDKATAKAMSAAYKQAMLQAFCIPAGEPDADRETYRLAAASDHCLEPVQGWEQWARDMGELIAGCTTMEAVGRVQNTYRGELRSLSKSHADLFAGLGQALADRRSELTERALTLANRDTTSSVARAAAPKRPATTGVRAKPGQGRTAGATEPVQTDRTAVASANGMDAGESGHA
jgi:hypothetical protein